MAKRKKIKKTRRKLERQKKLKKRVKNLKVLRGKNKNQEREKANP